MTNGVTMVRRARLALCLLFLAAPTFAQQIDGVGGASLTVKENDNVPTVSNVNSISFTNGTVTDNGGGSVSVTIGGTGAPADANYITQTANGTLSNEQALSALPDGCMGVTTTTGVIDARTITGTANQITVTNGNCAGNPTISIPTNPTLPGTWNVLSSGETSHAYSFMTVWTALASEGIALQYRSRLGGANVASANFVHVFAMNLSDDVTENTDWFFNEATADDAMSTAYEDGASITFTPGTASHDWLVLGDVLVDYAGQCVNYVSVRINAGTPVLPQAIIDCNNSVLEEVQFGLARVYTLPASSQTIKLQYAVSASTTANHLNSRIFAINLHKFRNHAFAYTESGTNLSATDYATQIQTLSITPDVQGDVFVGSYWSCDRNSSGNTCKQRIQIDNSDAPAGQTTAAYTFRHGIDGTDEDPMTISTLVANMTAAAHTIDLDGSVNTTTGTPTAKYASLWGFTMELAASGAGSSGVLRRRFSGQ